MKKITTFLLSTVFLSKTLASKALHRVVRITLFLIIFSSFSSYSIAGIQEKQDIPRMVQRSDLIIRGKVISTESQWKEDSRGRHIYTSVTVQILDEIKGNIKDDVFAFEVVGGTVDDIREVVSDTPAFEVDEDAILFLAEDPLAIQHGINGKIPIYDGRVYLDGSEATADSFIQTLKILGQDPNAPTSLEGKYPAPTEGVEAAQCYIYNGYKWFGTPPVVCYYINQNTSDCSGEGAAVQRAASTWNGCGADFTFQYCGSCSSTSPSQNGTNCIAWGTTTGSLATAYWWYYVSTKEIFECDVVFNDDYTWSTDPDTPSGEYDVESVALHEFGHWLNLADLYDSADSDKVMYGYINSGNEKRTLHSCDCDGICYIYGGCTQQYPDLYDDGESWRSFSPTTIQGGQNLSISCDVRNGGTAASGSFVVKFYASTNTTISSSDYYISQESMSSISAGSWANCDWSGTFPPSIPAGVYWVGWIIDADNNVSESNENNNTAYKQGYQLTVVPSQEPDLYDDGESYRSFSPTTIQEGQNLSISCDVRNGGTAASGSFVVKFYASTDTIISSSDYYISQESMSSISAGSWANCDWSGPFPSSIPAGVYWVGWIIDADNNVSESNENNNTAYKQGYQLTVVQPTLTVTSPDGGCYELDANLPIRWDSEYTSGDVKIDLYKGGSFDRIINPNTDDDGVYDWPIPTDGSLTGDCDYWIKVTDVSSSSCFDDSNYFCIATPPEAQDDSVTTPVDIPVMITLQATDEGCPDPPAALRYIITSLPIHGDLNEPGVGLIIDPCTPLVGYGNEVEYIPDSGYEGQDSFTFIADDGGDPPGGGDSNEATVSINVTACIFFDDFPSTTLDTNNWPDTSGTPTVDSLAGNEPSPPYSLHLEATDSVTSKVVDLYGCWSAQLNYCWKRVSTESADDLYLDYWDGNEWKTLQVLPGGANTSWEPNSVELPADALHSEFRLRFRADCDSSSDEWYIDDVCIQCQSCIEPPVLHDEPNTTQGTCNTIYWDPVADVNEYYAECANDANFTSIDANSGWITDTNYEFCGLEHDQIYWYRVKAWAPFSLKTWLQTSQVDFETDTLTDTIATSDGNVVLAGGGGTPTVDTVGNSSFNIITTTQGWLNCCLVTTETTLTQIEVYLGISASCSIEFVVYEGGVLFSDQYNRIHSSTLASSGTGTKFYSSDPISVPLEAGKHYMIGIVYSGSVTTYYDLSHSSPSFATHIGYGYYNGFPSPNILSNTYSTAYTFYHRYTTAQATGYSSPGDIVSTAIDLPADGNWEVVDFNTTIPADTELTVDILPAAGSTPIPGYENVSSGADLSGIGDPTIRLRANLSTADTNNTPVLHNWLVTYTDPALACESDWSNVESSRQCGTPGDFEPDCDVDYKDLEFFISKWLDSNCDESNSWCGGADFEPDSDVDFSDFAVFAENWLAGVK